MRRREVPHLRLQGTRETVLSPSGLRSSARTTGIANGRITAALTALAFALSTLIGLVHEATTRHVQCAEHGEQIHSDASPLARRVPANSLQQQTGATQHGHEHCLLAAAQRTERLAPSAPVLASVATGHATIIAAAPPSEALAPPRHVYRTAPKTSPPA